MIHVNLYESLPADKRYLAGEFFKTERFAGLSSFESFVTGIEYSFRTRQGEVIGSLVPDQAVALSEGEGRQYRVQLGGYPGVLRLVGKDNAFYVLMVVGADENEADTQRFLSSFVVGPVNTSLDSSGVIVDTPPNATQIEEALKALPLGPWSHRGAPISGGILNGKAVSLPVPEYPAAARLTGDSGEVAVQIIIDELGNVAWAGAAEGPATLREAAETSAWKARFTPTKLMGQPIKVSGRIIYNFRGSR
jgi:TonB family protein